MIVNDIGRCERAVRIAYSRVTVAVHDDEKVKMPTSTPQRAATRKRSNKSDRETTLAKWSMPWTVI